MIDVKADFLAKGNLYVSETGEIAANSDVLIDPKANWDSSVLGETVWVPYAANGGAPLVTTVTNVINGQELELAMPNLLSVPLTGLAIAVGSDDTTQIDAAIAAANNDGDNLLFDGRFGYSNPAGFTIGNGNATKVSDVQNIKLRGSGAGTGALLVHNVNPSLIRWMGVGVGSRMLRALGPLRIEIDDLAFDGAYRVLDGWDLMHAFATYGERWSVLRMNQRGVVQNAYQNPVGVYLGGGAGHFAKFQVASQGAAGFIGFDVGGDALVPGLDIATFTYEDGQVLIGDDTTISAADWQNGVWDPATTSAAFRARFADNVVARRVLMSPAGERRGHSIRIRPPAGARPFPTDWFLDNSSPVGKFALDTADCGPTGWEPDKNSGRGFTGTISTGDRSDPSKIGVDNFPESRDLGGKEGINLRSETGIEIDRHQQEQWRDGFLTYGATVLRRDNTPSSLTGTLTPTNVFSFVIPPKALRVFDRTPNANVYRWDRQVLLNASLAFLNDVDPAGVTPSLRLKAYLTAVVGGAPVDKLIFDAILGEVALPLARSPAYRSIDLELRLQARGVNNLQMTTGNVRVFAPFSGGVLARALEINKGQGQSAINADGNLEQTLRVEATLSHSSANMVLNANFATALLL